MWELAQALAIGAFTVAIALEWYVGRRYPFHDAVTNLSLGLGSVIFAAVMVLQGVTVHAWLDEHAVIVALPLDTVWAWIAITIAVDLCFYWSHRAMHRVNVLWAVHAPHHQSDQLNFLVALRIGWASVYLSWIFYLPLALFGVTIGAVLLARAISSLYQFLLHTELVGTLGPLEWIFNTPSHHRVHHAVNPRYLDRNHGGILIVWDRLFGTFAAEAPADPPVYGTVRPFASCSPLWSNAIEWVRLARMTRAARRWRDKLQLWLRPPAWRPADLGGVQPGPSAARLARPPHAVAVSRGLIAYLTVHVALAVGAAVLPMLGIALAPGPAGAVVLAIELVAAMVAWGALLERRRWAWWLEGARLASVAILAAVAVA